jgi:hypothetical protein
MMSEDQDREAVLERVEGYLDEAERSLELPPERKREVVDEMRADMMGLVARYRDEGKSESEAVDLALAEMGPVGEVSREIGSVVPPLSTGWVKWGRYGLSVLVILWTLRLLWGMRAWSYGEDGGMVLPLFIAIFAPIILILWPGIIWRKNWMFGVVPAFLACILFVALNAGGMSRSSGEFSVAMSESEAEKAERIRVEAEKEAAAEASLKKSVRWALAGFGGVTVILLFAMQQNGQRRVAIGCILVVGLGIEGVFQAEEAMFRRLVRQVNAVTGEAGRALGEEAVIAAGVDALERKHVKYYVSEDGKSFSIFWDRPLDNGFALVFNSKTGKVRVND